MIVVRLDGGLGNQMFQYAYGHYLAQRHGCQLVLDLESYAQQPQHGYGLFHFCIDAAPLSSEQRRLVPRRYRSAQHRGWRDWWPRRGLVRHKESPFGFREQHLAVGDNRYLVGYWQSERFFPGQREELLQHFRLRAPLSDASRRVADDMRATASVAVHVRRGDYVQHAAAAKLYCQLDADYYRSAIEQWSCQQTAPRIFVFSNDLVWCRQHLQLPWPTTFVDHNSAETAHEDLVLMSQAQCAVIANSTFSWWAAWLNNRPDRVVYAPPAWFQPNTLDGSSIVPASWRTLRPNTWSDRHLGTAAA